MANCPFCAEAIRGDEQTCPHCERDLTREQVHSTLLSPGTSFGTKATKREPFHKRHEIEIYSAVFIALAAIIVIVSLVIAKQGPKPWCPDPESPENVAFGECFGACASGFDGTDCGIECAKRHLKGFSTEHFGYYKLLICRGCDYEVMAGWWKNKDECVEKAFREKGLDKEE